jgi:competence ComEA-like helix-hairpin-helix protein
MRTTEEHERTRSMLDGNIFRTIRWTIALLVTTAAAMLVTIGAKAQDQDDAPAAAFRRVCSNCHDADRILATRRTRTQWEEVIEKMIDRGAEGTSDDFTTAEEYLLRVSGRVNVNRAATKDMVLVLGITQKDADAIAEYRKANGEIKDFDSLAKVPGIDLEKLNKARDAISF